MGGIGSGNYCRWSTKTTIEETKRIDIRMMARKNWLRPGIRGTLNWTCNGEPSGLINYHCLYDKLTLDYKYRINGCEWEPVTEDVYFDSTPCNYGNSRKWFLCPGCGNRCAILCSDGKYFLCRKCYDLPYASQMQGRLERLIDQKHKLGYRIFEDYDGEGWMKKKGMHKKVFNRLNLKYRQLDMAIDEGIFLRCGQYF